MPPHVLVTMQLELLVEKLELLKKTGKTFFPQNNTHMLGVV